MSDIKRLRMNLNANRIVKQKEFTLHAINDAKEEKGEAKGGCRCRKSLCNKKYCDCFSKGFACSRNCLCDNCQNGKVGIFEAPVIVNNEETDSQVTLS